MTDNTQQDLMDPQPPSSNEVIAEQNTNTAGTPTAEVQETSTTDASPEQAGTLHPESQVAASESALPEVGDLGSGFVEKETSLESVVEAVLFASDEPLSAERLSGIAEISAIKPIRECVDALNARYEETGRTFRIEQIAGGYQMMTLPIYNPWLKKLLRNRADNKFSPAALETLAIIAYKQPIIRADLEAIRGVASGEILRSLMYKGLVKIVGRAEIIGRPMLYGTTRKFLEVFGLNSIKDLPKAEDLKNPQS
jgi:segregation and condensation protein B